LSDLHLYYSPPQDKPHNLKDNRFTGPRGANSAPIGDKTMLLTLSFTFKEEDQSNNPQRCCFSVLHLYFAGAEDFFHCQKIYLNLKVMNMFIQINGYSSPEIQQDCSLIGSSHAICSAFP